MTDASIGTRDDLDRIYDRVLEKEVVRLMPGEFFVSREPEVLTTVLGSCVSACIRDKQLGIGGMNHFMLPDADMGAAVDQATAGRYGNHAMQFLIDGIVSLGRFRARRFGQCLFCRCRGLRQLLFGKPAEILFGLPQAAARR